MLNATICIGNSDNKLTQKDWSNYIKDVSDLITVSSYETYFAGFSDPRAPWQNACWVIHIGDDSLYFKNRLSVICKRYHQDSIAIIFGPTEFVRAATNG